MMKHILKEQHTPDNTHIHIHYDTIILYIQLKIYVFRFNFLSIFFAFFSSTSGAEAKNHGDKILTQSMYPARPGPYRT